MLKRRALSRVGSTLATSPAAPLAQPTRTLHVLSYRRLKRLTGQRGASPQRLVSPSSFAAPSSSFSSTVAVLAPTGSGTASAAGRPHHHPTAGELVARKQGATELTVETTEAAIAAQAEHIRNKKGFIIDMDGVVYHENKLIPGAKEMVAWLQKEGKEFLFLTNSSDKTPKDLKYKLSSFGIHVEEKNFYTSALSTANFISKQKPHGTAYVIGDAGILNALYNEGYTITDIRPDYVVVGETKNYNIDRMEKAINLVRNGAKLIGTNCDLLDKSVTGFLPACGTLVAPIVLATGVDAYFVGKPNPLIMRLALSRLGTHRHETVIIGDRMDTDIIAGVESEIDTVLVLSGVTSPAELHHFAYNPAFILDSLADITRTLPAH